MRDDKSGCVVVGRVTPLETVRPGLDLCIDALTEIGYSHEITWAKAIVLARQTLRKIRPLLAGRETPHQVTQPTEAGRWGDRLQVKA